MRIPLLRTLSGRIVLGFAVLILTFGAVSVLTVLNMQVLERHIRVIRKGYQPLALKAQDLSEKQRTLQSYLAEELTNEVTPGRVKQRIVRYRAARATLLGETEAILSDLRTLPATPKRMRLTEYRLRDIRSEIERQDELYETLLAAPPIERAGGGATPAERAKLRDAREALAQLRSNEARIGQLTTSLDRQQREFVERTASTLERNGRRLRLITFYLGITALVIGVLIVLWAVLTLRPLQRLRLAARRIAAGDYAGRIHERGPREVADLAHEFNLMGGAIEERERELVRSERLVAVGKMAAMITHEVRNPLSSIGLNTELLEEELAAIPEAEGAEARALCRAITHEVDRLTAITEEYLHFARLPKPKVQPENVAPIVRGLVDFERENLALRDVELAVELDDVPPVMVDEGQLRQALLNLIRNAADALTEIGGGKIIVSARCDDDPAFVLVCVTDDGPGIAHDLVPKLFDPFFSTKEGGTGLGLALTHQIIREHGGNITVDSEPGHGAAFRVALPVATRAPDEDSRIS